MPQFLNTIFPGDIELSIWHITENVDFFSQHEKWYEMEKRWIQSVHPKKRMEYLASRFLLYNKLQPVEKLPIIKNEFGKLVFKDSDSFLSISHSGNYTAYVLGPREVGLDVQVYDKKILRILPKFLSESELAILEEMSDDEEKIHFGILYWSAKEAVYKAHGKRGIQFKTQIKLNFTRSHLDSASLYLPDEKINYQLIYEFEKDFVWILAHHVVDTDIQFDFM
ncbi:MAG: 4'-phosphopantetheinyl transferase superfamily protein [Saprospiraceae bacterium]|nr:4'-phosphopantetheinyl transferase superfamily protein [Saprospiraceae bacterium]